MQKIQNNIKNQKEDKVENIIKAIRKGLNVEVEAIAEEYALLSAKKDIKYEDIVKSIKMSGINFTQPTDGEHGFLLLEDGRKMTISISRNVSEIDKNYIHLTMSYA